MRKDDLDELNDAVRENRHVTSAKHTAKAEKGDANTDKFRLLWDAACPEHRGAWGDRFDMKQAMERVGVLYATVGDVPEFLAWLAQEWHSLKFRTGTDWMVERGMLPRHPNMRFVVYHWSHFYAAYSDRAHQHGYDSVDPLVDDLREDIGFLETKLDEAAKFGQEAQLLRAREHIKDLEKEVKRLRDLLAPLIDLDTDLPTWEEKNAPKV